MSDQQLLPRPLDRRKEIVHLILPAILYVVGNGTERDKFFISFRVLCPI